MSLCNYKMKRFMKVVPGGALKTTSCPTASADNALTFHHSGPGSIVGVGTCDDMGSPGRTRVISLETSISSTDHRNSSICHHA